ncbi:MFS transporter [Geobacillus stearothermophilus]|uniref:MFS transporter n=1 Tax=Geobacillus TaxID=129337 RepID=UPI00067C2BBE|nr:hypothetical protein IB49_11665 [Geobacillus sp. LC300]ATA59696.1 permease of the major facilitator superfamily [Geobacillus stearothermophilus]KZE94226.1 Lysophospholipid transporter LplT [Geobacillus stearothermophilus]
MWKNQNLLILLGGLFIAELGIWFGVIGTLEFLQQHVHSFFLQSVILVSGILFSIVIGPFAGKVVDQTSKKTVIFWVSIMRIIAVCAMFIAIWQENFMWVFMYSIFIGGAAAFYFPAVQSSIPKVTQPEHLVKANALNFNLVTLARIFGAVLAGVLLVYVSVTTLFIIAIIAYFLLLMSTLFLRIEEPSITSRHSSEQTGRNIKGHRSFHEILSVINRLPVIKMILILTVFPFIFIGGFNLMVINISQLQDSSLIKGLLYGAEGLSIFIAGLTASRLKKGKNSVPLLLISCLLIGVAQMSLFLAEWRWLPVVSFALFGYVVGIFMPLSNTVCQELIPDEYLGRFFSLRRMLESFVQQVSVLCTGVLLDWIGFHWTVILLGLLTFIIVGLLCIRQLYEPIHYMQETKMDQ